MHVVLGALCAFWGLGLAHAVEGSLDVRTEAGVISALLHSVDAVPVGHAAGLVVLGLLLSLASAHYLRHARRLLLLVLCVGWSVLALGLVGLSKPVGAGVSDPVTLDPARLTFSLAGEIHGTVLRNVVNSPVQVLEISTSGPFSQTNDCASSLPVGASCRIHLTYNPAFCQGCGSAPCRNGVCLTPSCSDGMKNGNETDVDCGGSCGACGLGMQCLISGDCSSGLCAGGVCSVSPAPSCADGIRNGSETDVDCGGSCGACAAGKLCLISNDCTTGLCMGGTCAVVSNPTCSDGVKNGAETDVDCGGSCGACTVGQQCLIASDCGTGLCSGGVCAATPAPTCSDGVKNGSETDVDCGGGCGACSVGQQCLIASDCGTGLCSGGVCAATPAPTCSDGMKNGDETDVDCGGSCGACTDGRLCSVSLDCASGNCASGTCAAPSCADGIQNGLETDVDCGGLCGACAAGKHCQVSNDCSTSVCFSGTCAFPTCTDGVRNGLETDVDCGGPNCPSCALSKQCQVNSDCQTGSCVGGHCS